MRARAPLALSLAAVLLLGGCSVNHWGDLCQTDDDCGSSELVCAKADEENVSGLCRYAPVEQRCGPGTIVMITGDTVECVRDPDSPPDLVCGPGTVEQDRVCELE